MLDMMLSQIKDANAAAGYYFFEASTMRFFRSRVSETVYEGPGGVYFVTGEKVPIRPRRYTVRSFNAATGVCETALGCPFNEWSRAKAHRMAALFSVGGAA
jgi:hypothetical protein